MNLKIVLIYVVFLVVLFGPMYYNNTKRKKKFANMLNNLAIGNNIVTVGGIYGSVTKIGDNFVEIKVDKGVSIKIAKDAISRVEG